MTRIEKVRWPVEVVGLNSFRTSDVFRAREDVAQILKERDLRDAANAKAFARMKRIAKEVLGLLEKSMKAYAEGKPYAHLEYLKAREKLGLLT